MKGQVENSKCENECDSEWMNEGACKWVDFLWEKTLKDGHISLRSRKVIFNYKGSSGVE